MEIIVDPFFKNSQVEVASSLLLKFTSEKAFWDLLEEKFFLSGITDDLIPTEGGIRAHLEFMFTKALCTVHITPYSKSFSSVLGYAEGNTVFENTKKMGALTLYERVGHLGHETTHLFGYSHSKQGDRLSASVRFGEVLETYAEKRLKELNSVK